MDKAAIRIPGKTRIICFSGKTFSVTEDDMVGDGVATSEIAVFDASGFHFTQAHDGMSYTYTVEETAKGSLVNIIITAPDGDTRTYAVPNVLEAAKAGPDGYFSASSQQIFPNGPECALPLPFSALFVYCSLCFAKVATECPIIRKRKPRKE